MSWDLVIWLTLILVDFFYEMWGVAKAYRDVNAGPQPLTHYVREAMKGRWTVKLGLLAFWVWLGWHFFYVGHPL